MGHSIRRAKPEDTIRIYELYSSVAKSSKGLAREPEEITENFISTLIEECSAQGLVLVLENDITTEIDGVIHAAGNHVQALRHVLGSLTFLIRPQLQGKGHGKRLMQRFLDIVRNEFEHVYRVELRARSSNLAALGLYESLGFKKEGLFHSRIRTRSGVLEDGIPMVWLNPSSVEVVDKVQTELSLRRNIF